MNVCWHIKQGDVDGRVTSLGVSVSNEVMPTKSKSSSLSKGRAKVQKVLEEHKEGKLKSGSGKTVKNRKQAIAIALSEARKSGAAIPKKKKK